MNRRTLLAGLGVSGLASLSGCLGLIGMDEHESAPAGVDAAIRSETGYEQTGVDELTIDEEVDLTVTSERVVVHNYLTEHEKAVDVAGLANQRAAIFSVLTTPEVGALGRNFNPVEEMDARELVDLIEDNYDEIGNIEFEDDESVEILEQTTTRSWFTADAEFEGTSLTVDLHVTEAVSAGDDLLVSIGVYPADLRSREEDNVIALMENIVADINEADDDEDASDDEPDNGDDETDEGEPDDGDSGDGSDGDEDGEEDDGADDGDETTDDDGDDGLLTL
ncbi:hypothetical protein G6M89_21790 [Natronolimnobius sp. AArcel1]|uniref:DUF6517 family protein n=1 Tax=Natronolimnobius sp. AArcel1 TaxID=1679093 RepID=UPI0013EA0CC1|nr:DUF6517 family protein [Natronolimnobius sp. AArcel1]NGM71580.1 hypothetical protein [Natronolimnobius sp. AArcel1]